MSTGFKGGVAEDIAVQYLKEQGYSIRGRNFRFMKSEIDIVAYDEPFIVFVEVKSRASTKFGYPESAINRRKLEMMEIGITGYLQEKKIRGPFRLDVISVLFRPEPEITHFKDVAID